MTTTQFLLVSALIIALFYANLWRWNHPTEWTALKARIAAWFGRKP